MRLTHLRTMLACSLAVGVVGVSLPAAADDEVTQRPASSSTLSMVGRGYGHGRGMSQWGAYGAASRYGLSWRQILDFYYPGTSLSELSDSTIRVWISGDRDNNTTVLPTAGLSATAGGVSVTLPTGDSYRAWRAVKGSGVALQYKDASGAWKSYASGLPTSNDVAFSVGAANSRRRIGRAMSGNVRVILPSGSQQELRGIVHATVADGTLRTVLHSTMESYLRGVVPAEMPASWHKQALAAQSVAARTYAAAFRDRQRARGASWDICDTVSCQVFKGVATYSSSGRSRSAEEDSRANDAIALTTGMVLRSGSRSGSLANTEFSSSNGGYTAAGDAPYIVAKPDPYDGAIPNSSNSWSTSVSIAGLESRYGLGSLTEVRVIKRDGNGPLGGRVLQMALVGDKKTVTLSGMSLRTALRLRSDWFAFPAASSGRSGR